MSGRASRPSSCECRCRNPDQIYTATPQFKVPLGRFDFRYLKRQPRKNQWICSNVKCAPFMHLAPRLTAGLARTGRDFQLLPAVHVGRCIKGFNVLAQRRFQLFGFPFVLVVHLKGI